MPDQRVFYVRVDQLEADQSSMGGVRRVRVHLSGGLFQGEMIVPLEGCPEFDEEFSVTVRGAARDQTKETT